MSSEAVVASERRVEVPRERLVQDWREAHERARAYLEALGFGAAECQALAFEAVERAVAAPWEGATDSVGATLAAARRLAVERRPPGTPAREATDDDFLASRLETALGGRQTRRRTTPFSERRVQSGPALDRRSMVSEPAERGLFRRLGRRLRWGRAQPKPSERALRHLELRRSREQLPWVRVAHRRRALLFALVLIPTTIASAFMTNVLPRQGETWLEVLIIVFFGTLFGWISIGFWTALLGFITLVRGRDRFAITALTSRAGAAGATSGPGLGGPTAIVMPICDEPVDRVFAGLRAIHRSLERAGVLDRFHFFVISDSGDPGTVVREEMAWFDWCREADAFDRVFYRHREIRIERKAGNVADFLRRWGARYRYMISLDADSVMTAATLVRLVELMDQHSDVGMIQTSPAAVNRRSFFARVQQFASRVYGPMFAAGLHYWQLGDGQYWGHNTIVRVAPFMRHCGLPRLPGREPLGGQILSHDFVEAALLGRAGWTLWLAYALEGSYEEVPSTLLEEMRRDRRWCQGNLQHLQLLFTEGLFGAHRALFLNGALSYVSALLWSAFLLFSTTEAIWYALSPPEYFPHGASLFPEWPIWRPNWAIALVTVIALILFLPKLLSVLLVVLRHRGGAAAYGGALRLTTSVLAEILLSSLLAPIRMVFHSRFVLLNLLGRTVTWGSQQRSDDETGWGVALRHHGLDSLIASVWGAGLFWLSPHYFWWVTPIVGALVLAVPLSVLTSSVRVGDWLRRARLFLIPEETAPPPELRDLDELLAAAGAAAARLPALEQDGFVRAAVDPFVNAVHRALLGPRRRRRASIEAARRRLVERAVAEGPAALARRERRTLLLDPDMTDELHRRVWAAPQRTEAARWGRPGAPGAAAR